MKSTTTNVTQVYADAMAAQLDSVGALSTGFCVSRRLNRPVCYWWCGEAKKRARKPIDRRRIFNVILYWNRTGCQWRYLPKDFPHWNTVYGVFRNWRIDGTWKRIHDGIREQVRKAAGKKPTPTGAIIDSQLVRTAEGGERRGFDGGRKITDRKRHIVVDTLELPRGEKQRVFMNSVCFGESHARTVVVPFVQARRMLGRCNAELLIRRTNELRIQRPSFEREAVLSLASVLICSS